jgi:hypothetical protein
MISFIKGLYFDLDCRVQRVLVRLRADKFHPDIQRQFVPKTIEYLEELDLLLQTKMNSGELDVDFFAPNNLTDFNQYYEWFKNIEFYRISVIMNYREEAEGYLNKKIEKIYREIKHLSNPPILTTISNSQDYYWAETYFEIIAVPYGEEHNLLNLPDLYHEIGHLIFRQYPDIVEDKFLPVLHAYFDEQINLSKDENTDNHYNPFFTEKKKHWEAYWIEEFTCDMIATYLCGPAFAWANMKMSAISNGSKAIFIDSPSHPSDESRMRAVFMMLNKTGFAHECGEITASWEEFLSHTNNPKDPDYKFIFPDKLLEELTEIVFNYCKGIDLATYKEQTDTHKNPISKVVNDAWIELHNQPFEFERIQKELIEAIKDSFKI